MKGVPVACKDGEWFTHGAGRGGTPEIEVVEDGIVGSPRTAASNAFRRDPPVAPARSASVGNGLHTLSPSYTLSSPVGNIGHSGKGSAFSTAWTKFFGYVLYVKYCGLRIGTGAEIETALCILESAALYPTCKVSPRGRPETRNLGIWHLGSLRVGPERAPRDVSRAVRAQRFGQRPTVTMVPPATTPHGSAWTASQREVLRLVLEEHVNVRVRR